MGRQKPSLIQAILVSCLVLGSLVESGLWAWEGLPGMFISLVFTTIPHPGPLVLWQGKGEQQGVKGVKHITPLSIIRRQAVFYRSYYCLCCGTKTCNGRRNQKFIPGVHSLLYPRTLFWESQYGYLCKVPHSFPLDLVKLDFMTSLLCGLPFWLLQSFLPPAITAQLGGFAFSPLSLSMHCYVFVMISLCLVHI